MPDALDEKLEPLDLLLPLPELLPDPLLLDCCEIPGPLEPASLWVQTPSARYVLVPGTRIATVRTRPSSRSSELIRSSTCDRSSGTINRSPTFSNSAEQKPH